jgi:hypothetical protein
MAADLLTFINPNTQKPLSPEVRQSGSKMLVTKHFATALA